VKTYEADLIYFASSNLRLQFWRKANAIERQSVVEKQYLCLALRVRRRTRGSRVGQFSCSLHDVKLS
jgi:hypothetical protein